MRDSWTRITSLMVCGMRPLLKQASHATNIASHRSILWPMISMEARIGRTVFKALVDVRAKLRFPKLLYVQHRDVSHHSSLEGSGSHPGAI